MTMEIKFFVLIAIIICFIGGIIGIILTSIRSFEKDVNKKIDKLNDRIDDIGYKTDDIEPQYNSLYTKLNLLSLMLNDIRKSQNNINNNNKPKDEK